MYEATKRKDTSDVIHYGILCDSHNDKNTPKPNRIIKSQNIKGTLHSTDYIVP